MSWPPATNLWLLSPRAMGYVPIIAFHLVISGYLVFRKNKSPQTWLFTAWMLCLMAMMGFQCAAYTIYAPLGGYLLWIGSISAALLALAVELQFAYHFPHPDDPRQAWGVREGRVVLVISGVIAASFLTWMAVEAATIPTQSTYDFEHFVYGTVRLDNGRSFESAIVFDFVHIGGRLWLLGVWLRKLAHFAAASRSGDRKPIRHQWPGAIWQLAQALWRPQGKEAKAARDFSLLAVLVPLAVVIELLEAWYLLPTASFATAYLLVIFGVILAYVNNASEPVSFAIKLVGSALISLLIVIGLANPIVFGSFRDAYEELRQAELVHIKKLLETDGGSIQSLVEGQLPASVLYVVARPAAGELFLSEQSSPAGYRLLFSRIEDLSAQVFAQEDAHFRSDLAQGRQSARLAVLSEYPWVERVGRVDVWFSGRLDQLTIPHNARGYRGIYASPEEQYIRYTLTSQDGHVLYEVGYSYLDYRHMLHSKALPWVYLTLGATLLVLFVLPRFFWVSLVQPLNDLVSGVRRVNAGNLDTRVPVRVQDEIGFLTHSFNDMVSSLRSEMAERERAEAEVRALNVSLEQRVADRTRELAALYDVSAVASQAQDIETLLAGSLSRVMAAMGSQVGAVYLVDEAQPRTLRLAVQQGIPTDIAAYMDTWPLDGDLAGWITEHREPLLIANTSTTQYMRGAMRRVGPMTLLTAPIQAGSQVLGLLSLGRELEQSFSAEEVALLSSIADQVGTAVQRDRLLQQTAVWEERQRIARDMHDSVTQSLYGLLTFAEAGQAQLRAGTAGAMEPVLTRIGETTRQALREMRLFIYQLYPPILEQEGLVSALHQRLAFVEGRSDLDARLVADESITSPLPAPVENALYQIAQEALNNVLRHARATSVTIYLRRLDEQVTMEIVDDGQGFEPDAVPKGRLGLSNIRARAGQIGGTVHVTSAPGQGTRLSVIVEGVKDYGQDSYRNRR